MRMLMKNKRTLTDFKARIETKEKELSISLNDKCPPLLWILDVHSFGFVVELKGERRV